MPNGNVPPEQKAEGFLHACALYVLPPPNRALVCCVVGTSLREGWEWKGSTCQRTGCGEARVPSSRAGNWRLLVRLAPQLHCFAALQGSRALSAAQPAGSGSGTRGWPRVFGCASAQQALRQPAGIGIWVGNLTQKK